MERYDFYLLTIFLVSCVFNSFRFVKAKANGKAQPSKETKKPAAKGKVCTRIYSTGLYFFTDTGVLLG